MDLARLIRFVLFGACFCAGSLFAIPYASATLTFYYDPLTGNVSFDTSNTRTGGLYIYQLEVVPGSPIRFRTENYIRTFNSTYAIVRDNKLGDASLANPVEGLITIGDVLPPGLTEEIWYSFAPDASHSSPNPVPSNPSGYHYYLDDIGNGHAPAAELVYGKPEGEFDNRWDLIDPNTLDWAETAKLVYRPSSGELLLNTTGASSGYVTGIVLESSGDFHNENFNVFVNSSLTSSTSSIVGLIADAIEPGIYSLGNVLEARLSQAQLEAKLSSAKFYGRAGYAGGNLDLQADGNTLTIVVVPEPTGFTLLAMIALACGAVRTEKK